MVGGSRDGEGSFSIKLDSMNADLNPVENGRRRISNEEVTIYSLYNQAKKLWGINMNNKNNQKHIAKDSSYLSFLHDTYRSSASERGK